jgi:hypothetical protein
VFATTSSQFVSPNKRDVSGRGLSATLPLADYGTVARDGAATWQFQVLRRGWLLQRISPASFPSGTSTSGPLGQVHDGDIAAMTIDCVPPHSRHLQPNTPAVLTWIIAWLVEDKVAVVDDDGNLGKFHELGHWDADRRERPTGTRLTPSKCKLRADLNLSARIRIVTVGVVNRPKRSVVLQAWA